jgi:hypothetical protein
VKNNQIVEFPLPVKRKRPERVVLTVAQHAMVKRAVKRLIAISIEDAQKGGGYPEDYELIARDLRSARSSFWSLFKWGPL